jgi:hypothetical protein
MNAAYAANWSLKPITPVPRARQPLATNALKPNSAVPAAGNGAAGCGAAFCSECQKKGYRAPTSATLERLLPRDA